MQLNQKDVFNLIGQSFGQKNLLTVPVILLKKLKGDHAAALFLGQLIYWSDKGSDINGWIYKTYADWEKELFIKRDKAMAIKTKLEKLALIETQFKKTSTSSHPVLHYKVNADSLIQFLMEDDDTPPAEDMDDKEGNNNTSPTEEKEAEKKLFPDEKDEESSFSIQEKSPEDAAKEQNNPDCRYFRQSDFPTVENPDCRKIRLSTVGISYYPTSSINYIHKLLKDTSPCNLTSLDNDKERLLFLKHKRYLFDLAKQIYEIFAKINAPDNFTVFLMSDFKKGLIKLIKQKIPLDIRLVAACENYSRVLALQKTQSTWWKAVLNFNAFCKETILHRYFLNPNFDIKIFKTNITRAPPLKKGDCNNKWVSEISDIPF